MQILYEPNNRNYFRVFTSGKVNLNLNRGILIIILSEKLLPGQELLFSCKHAKPEINSGLYFNSDSQVEIEI